MRKNIILKDVEILEGTYAGRHGRGEYFEGGENIMVYPVEGEYPYRTCVGRDKIRVIEA